MDCSKHQPLILPRSGFITQTEMNNICFEWMFGLMQNCSESVKSLLHGLIDDELEKLGLTGVFEDKDMVKQVFNKSFTDWPLEKKKHIELFIECVKKLGIPYYTIDFTKSVRDVFVDIIAVDLKVKNMLVYKEYNDLYCSDGEYLLKILAREYKKRFEGDFKTSPCGKFVTEMLEIKPLF